MSDAIDTVALQASIADFHRRVRVLEAAVHGDEQRPLPIDLLQGLYVDAFARREPTVSDARMWARQAFMLDARQLLILAQITGDMHPWRPILGLLDHFLGHGFEEVRSSRAHLLSVAQDLLDAQGLDLIQPYDVMGQPYSVRAAISALSGD
jgi:hypothetical protein